MCNLTSLEGLVIKTWEYECQWDVGLKYLRAVDNQMKTIQQTNLKFKINRQITKYYAVQSQNKDVW